MNLREELLGVLIALGHTVENNEILQRTHEFVLAALPFTREQTKADEDELRLWIARANEEKFLVSPSCRTCLYPCGKNENYDMQRIWLAEPSVRQKKLQMLEQLYVLAGKIKEKRAYDEDTMQLVYETLFALGEDFEVDVLERFACEVRAYLDER